MKIVADENIPLLKGVFEPYATVVYAAGNTISNPLIKDADALLIRTRTDCNQQLLENTNLKFIGTATIGTDHIDLAYCRQQGITVASAAGCNAAAVMQYVARTLVAIEEKTGKKLMDCTLGIVGVGHVGRLVHQIAHTLGLQVLLNDPPLALLDGATGFIPLEELLSASDIVTLHVPLDNTTKSLANARFFERMKTQAAFINTSRGEVVDEGALLQYRSKFSFVALDVWRNEPHINLDLLAATDLATPHIAGYSLQGKCNATTMIVQALANYFGIQALTRFVADCEAPTDFLFPQKGPDDMHKRISENYTIFEDDKLLRSEPHNFEQLRNNYKLRKEISVDAKSVNP